jgi:hypothetical protein
MRETAATTTATRRVAERGVIMTATASTTSPASVVWPEQTRFAPSGPGALEGFGWDCPICGMRVASSLPSIARRETWEHADWHIRRGR